MRIVPMGVGCVPPCDECIVNCLPKTNLKKKMNFPELCGILSGIEKPPNQIDDLTMICLEYRGEDREKFPFPVIHYQVCSGMSGSGLAASFRSPSADPPAGYIGDASQTGTRSSS